MTRKKHLLVAVLCLGTLPMLTWAADDKADDVKPIAKSVNRLPAHYGKLVDKVQREKIYSIQAKYSEKIEELQEQLKDVLLQRDAEIRAILTDEQQQKLDELLAAAKAKVKGGAKQAATEASEKGDSTKQ
ncbi:MAG: hypothetical protein IT427_03105 [Pirellulales bacterium]|nr:hypothetical protein [Pirellulales bacterium]